MRIEQIGDATLYCGDCLEILPTLGRVDACVSDPPYGINANTKSTRFSGGSVANQNRRSIGCNYPAVIGDDAPFDPRPLLGFRQVILWGFNHFSQHLPQGGGLVWLKRNEEAFGTFLSDAEIGWEKNKTGVFCFRSFPQKMAVERAHPTQKPVDLMRWCIERTNGIILDPYMGSGTTGVAAIQLGRKFIGIEIDPGYFEIACRRIEEAWKQPRLFEEPKRKPEPAPNLFDGDAA